MLTHRLQDVLHDLVSGRRVPHAILAVKSGDGSFRWTGPAGDARPDGTPLQADTPYFIASVDKLFTATVILKLRKRGAVDLDEPISTYLAERLIGRIHRLDGVDHTTDITVRHLLSHTSGLADWLEDRPKGGLSLIGRLVREGDIMHLLQRPHGVARHSQLVQDRRQVAVAAGVGHHQEGSIGTRL